MIKNCLVCNNTFYCKPAIEAVRHTCSRKCASIRQSKIMKGRNLNPHPRKRADRAVFICKYCGKEKVIRSCRLTYGEGQFCSRQCSNKAYDRRGLKNPNWRGGVTPRKVAIRKSNAMKEWRNSVFRRDHWLCQQCGTHASIEAHHIIPFAVLLREDRDLFDPANGITLCTKCHANLDPHRYIKPAGQLNVDDWSIP